MTERNHAVIIQTGPKGFSVPNDSGYSMNSRKTLRGAIRLARTMYPGLPIHVMWRGPMTDGRADLTLSEIIPA